MTPDQVSLVKSSWAKVVPIADQAAQIFYGRLFDLDPDLKPLFKSDPAEQRRKLMASINTVVNSLDNLGAIVPAVQDMGKRHVGYGVKDEHYNTVGSALLWTLGQGLGPAFDAPTKEAWTVAYGILADTMKAAAATAVS